MLSKPNACHAKLGVAAKGAVAERLHLNGNPRENIASIATPVKKFVSFGNGHS
jgi:hypothetical protein